jgi:type I restriction enzyme M protein
MNTQTLVQKRWNCCNVLRDDGVSYGDYPEQLTYPLVPEDGARAQPAAKQPAQHRVGGLDQLIKPEQRHLRQFNWTPETPEGLGAPTLTRRWPPATKPARTSSG